MQLVKEDAGFVNLFQRQTDSLPSDLERGYYASREVVGKTISKHVTTYSMMILLSFSFAFTSNRYAIPAFR